MRFFFDSELFDNGLHSDLDAASVQWGFNQMRIFQSPFPVWKQKTGMPVDRPEISQDLQRFFRQGNQPVLVSLGVSNMGFHFDRVYIADLKSDSLAEAQAHGVGGEKENRVLPASVHETP